MPGTEGERRELTAGQLDRWFSQQPRRPATLTGLFEARATATPDAVAVACGDAVVSYGELDAAAGRLARLLAARGAGPESVVAVGLERSAGLVTTVLAVAKAGAAYLPVDPENRAQRTGFMLADARPVVIVTAPETPGD